MLLAPCVGPIQNMGLEAQQASVGIVGDIASVGIAGGHGLPRRSPCCPTLRIRAASTDPRALAGALVLSRAR
jgi:hypothetical protein